MKTKHLSLSTVLLVTTALLNQSCNKNVSTSQVNGSSSDNGTGQFLNSNLVAWYTFNGNVLDHSGHNNNITFNNATPTAGILGVPNTAFYFDGTSSYMSAPNSASLNPTHGITLVALIKPMGFYSGVCHGNRIINKEYNDNSTGRYLLGYDDAPYYNFLGCHQVVQPNHETFVGIYGDGQGTASQVLDLTETIKLNRWYLVVYTCDGTTSKLYLNGVLQATNTQSTSFTPNTAPLLLGKTEDPNFPYAFKGVMDEILIFSKAFNLAEVQKLSVLMN